MALNQILDDFPKIFRWAKIKGNSLKNLKMRKYLLYFFLIFVAFIIYLIIFNIVNQKNKNELKNFNSVVSSEEFMSVGEYFVSKINNPYEEVR